MVVEFMNFKQNIDDHKVFRDFKSSTGKVKSELIVVMTVKSLSNILVTQTLKRKMLIISTVLPE